MKITPILFSLVLAMSCNTSSQKSNKSISLLEPVQTEVQNGQHKAYFASGCFWCVEAVFENVKGVSESVSGYSGGIEDNPTYKEVGYGRTTHAEAVEIFYDPEIVSFETLVDVFFGSHDPTTLNRQGPDAGPQYRSIAFYQNAAEKKIIEDKIAALNANTYEGKIVTQVMPFQKFWIAEGYHQNYERLNPDNPYIRNVSVPRLKRFQAKFPELLKDGSH